MEQIKAPRQKLPWKKQIIVFVVSGKEGITDADEYVAQLYKTHKPVILAVNKVDNPEMRNDIYDFYASVWVNHRLSHLSMVFAGCARCHRRKSSKCEYEEETQMSLSLA